MPKLGLSTGLTRSGIVTPGIVTSNLVLKHNYSKGSVIPVSDGAAFFDGTDDYINCASDSSIDIGTSALSVTFWVYLNVVETLAFVGKGPSISSTTDGTSGWCISLYGSNSNVYFDANTGNDPAERDVVYTSTNSITANKWYHIAVVIPASGDDGRKIYIDGADKTSVSQHVNTDLGDASVDLWFGDVPTGGTRELNGYMCNVGIWKGRVLTQPEIKSIMNKNYAGLTSSEKTNLVSWWNLDEGIETGVAGTNDIVLDNNASNLDVVDWPSNFIAGAGVVTNSDQAAPGYWSHSGTANGSTTFTYINNDNRTIRLNTTNGDHVMLRTASGVLTVGKSYKFVVTVDSIEGRFRIRPGENDPDGDMLTTGVHTFYFYKSVSDYWRIERDSGVGDITVSDIKIYDIGNIGELS